VGFLRGLAASLKASTSRLCTPSAATWWMCSHLAHDGTSFLAWVRPGAEVVMFPLPPHQCRSFPTCILLIVYVPLFHCLSSLACSSLSCVKLFAVPVPVPVTASGYDVGRPAFVFTDRASGKGNCAIDMTNTASEALQRKPYSTGPTNPGFTRSASVALLISLSLLVSSFNLYLQSLLCIFNFCHDLLSTSPRPAIALLLEEENNGQLTDEEDWGRGLW
jgi:hypothetical protein